MVINYEQLSAKCRACGAKMYTPETPVVIASGVMVTAYCARGGVVDEYEHDRYIVSNVDEYGDPARILTYEVKP